MDDKETWKNKMTKNTACKLKSNPMTTKHTTVILPAEKISKKELQDKIEARIEEINSRDSQGWASYDAAQVAGLKYVLSLLKTIR